ncbi:major facilitator superfamily domain-containing protein [Crucibulum laeve]|uniref:Major facilitator superfamily domain-containing protein n=1 Tax=Crucibulum laeve TaxID=68775 RepID=A0A5C3MCT7_9AGAR|nr:major facilitator superfamily domain-containing protein [Crucibulum laeve]
MTDAASNETTLLLHDESTQESQSAPEVKYPFSAVQLGLLCYLRMLDPMNFSQIFPYINQFIRDLHITEDPSQIPFYSGLVESAFAVSQLLAIYPWGLLSDTLGRRPVILLGAIGLSMTTLLFGFSRTFFEMFAARALAGLFSGNVAVIPSMLCEITSKGNQSTIFPFFGLWWPIGAIIGPLIGGNFAYSATKYPKYLDYRFLRIYPYFFPCLLISITSAVGFLISYFFLKETLPCSLPTDNTGTTSYSAIDYPDQFHNEKYSIKKILRIPIIRAVCISGCALSFVSTAFDVVFVLFCYSPITKGGLAFSTTQIGFALAASGVIAALLQVLIMPTILRHVDHAKMYHFCMKLWPYTFLGLPVLNMIAVNGLDAANGELNEFTQLIIWMGIAVILSMARVGFLAYSVSMLLVREHSPHPSALGSTTGIVQFAICFARAFSPAFTSAIFALSIDMELLYGNIWVVVLVGIASGSCIFSKKVMEKSNEMNMR